MVFVAARRVLSPDNIQSNTARFSESKASREFVATARPPFVPGVATNIAWSDHDVAGRSPLRSSRAHAGRRGFVGAPQRVGACTRSGSARDKSAGADTSAATVNAAISVRTSTVRRDTIHACTANKRWRDTIAANQRTRRQTRCATHCRAACRPKHRSSADHRTAGLARRNAHAEE